MGNKRTEVIINYYNQNKEDGRIELRKSHLIEYITTMQYIHKFAKKGCRILEVGAGTGVYSIELAKQGYNVTAIDLSPAHVEIMQEKSKGVPNFNCFVADALNLSTLKDNTFDIVLNLGPMYHLYNQKDKDKAILESLRVLKPNGVAMFAYLTHASIVWGYGVRKNHLSSLKGYLTKEGKIKDCMDEVFSSFYIEDFHKQFEKLNTTHIADVATDGIFPMMRAYIDDVMSDGDYQSLVDWHLATCERKDQQGYSSHMLYICKKNK